MTEPESDDAMTLDDFLRGAAAMCNANPWALMHHPKQLEDMAAMHEARLDVSLSEPVWSSMRWSQI